MALKLVVSGFGGRMGGTLRQLIETDDRLELIAGIDRDESAQAGEVPLLTVDRAGDALRAADVVIDFSAPAFLRSLLEGQAEALRGTAVLVGTTGLEDADQRLLDEAAEHSPVLVAANFSVAVNLLLALAEQAARVLADDYDVEIVEAHHRRKEDAPSGTALALGEAVARGRAVKLSDVRRDGRSGRPGARPRGEVGFHALRGGSVVGRHDVHLFGELDSLTLSHHADDRSLFAAGALRAARWLAEQKPGRYAMRDVLGLD